MDKFVINGGRKLHGDVRISGAKNAAVAIIPAAILAEDICRIENVPNINDVTSIARILQEMGAVIRMVNKSTLEIDSRHINSPVASYDLVRHMRASYYLLGALLGRFSHAKVALPGGCNFGVRPIDQHLKGFRALGATGKISNGMIIVDAKKLVGARIYFDKVSVGATINVMLAATLAEGRTVLENVAKEPHIVDVANMLNSMGANIKGAGTDVIRIEGVKKLHGAEYSVIPDQIEAGTFMMAAAATRGDITVKNVIPKHLDCLSSKLREIGCEVSEFDDAVRVVCKERLHATSVNTLPYPGFPTDMQPQMSVVLALARGTSVVTESIFDNRFRYVDELIRMGASIQVESNIAIINGIEQFSGTSVTVPDLRAGAALVIAGLAAQGVSVLEDIVYIKRGYEDFAEKLTSLGGVIEEVETEKDIQRFRLKNGTTNW